MVEKKEEQEEGERQGWQAKTQEERKAADPLGPPT